MTKNLHHAEPLHCVVPDCWELPQLGSSYCVRHAALRRGDRRIPSWMLWPILIALVAAIVLLVVDAEHLLVLG